MTPLVKICGITNFEDALVCASAGADMLGFIFYAKSPRCIEPSKAAGIIKHLPSHVVPVGVFVNEDRDIINKIVTEARFRQIQLSGDEPAEDCEHFDVPVWKVFRISQKEDVATIKQYKVNAAMLDGASNTEYGGSGRLADFAIATEMKKYHNVVLAGGLNPENITAAVNTVRPYAVDVNSGVEITPGKKDPHRVRMLFERLKG